MKNELNAQGRSLAADVETHPLSFITTEKSRASLGKLSWRREAECPLGSHLMTFAGRRRRRKRERGCRDVPNSRG